MLRAPPWRPYQNLDIIGGIDEHDEWHSVLRVSRIDKADAAHADQTVLLESSECRFSRCGVGARAKDLEAIAQLQAQRPSGAVVLPYSVPSTSMYMAWYAPVAA